MTKNITPRDERTPGYVPTDLDRKMLDRAEARRERRRAKAIMPMRRKVKPE
jgi:hypothetical protein